jgi:hypothetical protein
VLHVGLNLSHTRGDVCLTTNRMCHCRPFLNRSGQNRASLCLDTHVRTIADDGARAGGQRTRKSITVTAARAAAGTDAAPGGSPCGVPTGGTGRVHCPFHASSHRCASAEGVTTAYRCTLDHAYDSVLSPIRPGKGCVWPKRKNANVPFDLAPRAAPRHRSTR